MGGLILDASGAVLEANCTAVESLGASEAEAHGPEHLRDRLKDFFRQAEQRFNVDQESWIVVPRLARRPLVIRSIPVGDSEDPHARTIVILVDLASYLQPSTTAVQRMFGLSEAEAGLALRISAGATPADIAEEKGVKLSTVRSQLASVFAKTQASR